MATIKGFTSVEQCRKLAEILPLESADMHYCLENRDVATGYEIGIVPFIQARRFKGKCNIVDVQPAWSLAALLEQLDEEITDNNGNDYTLTILKEALQYQLYYHDSLGRAEGIETYYYDNMVDACYEMILRLHERKML